MEVVTPKTVAKKPVGTDDDERSPGHADADEARSPTSSQGSAQAKEVRARSLTLYESAMKKEEVKKQAELERKSEHEMKRQVGHPCLLLFLRLLPKT